jgi:DNA modification methylase
LSQIQLYNEDCLIGMQKLESNSIDSIVTDPPYEIGFMNKSWDNTGIAYNINIWKECLRILKPGGHLLAFGGTRTYHRMACAIEDAGFEIRDQIQWLYGSGFPKSLNISKAIDKHFEAKREVVGEYKHPTAKNGDRTGNKSPYQANECHLEGSYKITIPATKEAEQWDGWGTALKPANEPIVVARKPLSEKTVAENVLKWGTGGINIDACRVGTEERTYGLKGGENLNNLSRLNGKDSPDAKGCGAYGIGAKQVNIGEKTVSGRFPANVILDEEAGKILDEQTGILTSGKVKPEGFKGEFTANVYGKYANNQIDPNTVYGDSGGASRFFYCAKASKKERGEGNNHPTVKPVSLMQYLVKLVTPLNGTVLDPFMGSGTTGIACGDNFSFIGFEKEKIYYNIAQERIEKHGKI